MKADINMVNKINTRLVMQSLYNDGPISKADIARNIHLSLPSVMKIVDTLIQKDLACEVGKGVSTGGKPPDLLDIKQYAYYAIGIEINENRLVCSVVNLKGREIFHRTRELPAFQDKVAALHEVCHFIDDIIKRTRLSGKSILAICFTDQKIMGDQAENLIQIGKMPISCEELKQFVQQQYPYEVLFVNSVQASVVVQQWQRRFAPSTNYLYVDLSKEIRSSLILNNQFYSSPDYLLGNIAHQTVKDCGIRCDCGGYGCLKTFFSAENILKSVQLLPEFRDATIDLSDVFYYIENQHTGVLSCVSELLKYVVTAICNLYKTCRFDYVIFGGEMIEQSHMLFELSESLFNQYKSTYGLDIPAYEFRIDRSYSMGAAIYVLKALLDNGGHYFSL